LRIDKVVDFHGLGLALRPPLFPRIFIGSNQVLLLRVNRYDRLPLAARVGYPDPYYFSRAFKKVTASAPKHYRNVSKG
jgi:hypothetical protein